MAKADDHSKKGRQLNYKFFPTIGPKTFIPAIRIYILLFYSGYTKRIKQRLKLPGCGGKNELLFLD